MIITGDFTNEDWVLLLEDDGPTGLGRVLEYVVFDNSSEALAVRLDAACDMLGLFMGEDIPRNQVATEVMTYGDFIASYGNRMPLCNRYEPKEGRS